MGSRRHVFSALLTAAVLLASSWVPAVARGETQSDVLRTHSGPMISAKASRSVAAAGRKVAVSGALSEAGRRPVMVETEVAGEWRTLAAGNTRANGRYRLKLPTTWYGRHTLRVRAPASGASPEGTSHTWSMRVKPAYKPVGNRSDYDLPYQHYRWNPCQPIEWRFHKGRGFSGSLKVIRRALTEISRGTGLTFTYAGTTSKVPVRDDTSGVADLVIGWATAKQVSQLAGDTAGYGGASGSGPDQAHLEINHGVVALDQTESLAPTYAESGRVAWGQVMVHELGHAIGLNHANSPDQLMYATATTSNARLGRGDLRGMELVGLAQGCWDQGAR
ncbi:hypothetical protein BH09ACT12_BH09ACT12_20400 [soil metagenome]